MKILHVTPTIGRDGGGPSRCVQGLVAALCEQQVDVILVSTTVGETPWLPGVGRFIGAEDFEGFEALYERERPDLVHINGLWTPSLHQACAACRKLKIPYVFSPHGTLEPWALRQKWLKKRIARFLYQDKDLKYAVALHATAPSEAINFRKLGFGQKCIISPNGVNLPVEFRRECAGGSAHRVLFVSRMHPKKGVLNLVEAWKSLIDTFTPCRNWVCELVYTILDETERHYEMQVKNRVHALGLDDCFVFTGPLGDDEKWRAYARADLFVLPTFSENFGIVVAEALWAKVPVITTTGAPWSELNGRAGDCRSRSGWWIEIGVQPLCQALKEAMSCSEEERALWGENGRRLVEDKYTWSILAKQMLAAYENILLCK